MIAAFRSAVPTIGYLQGNLGIALNTTSATLTFTDANTSGNCLVVIVGLSTGSILATVSDSNGNIWYGVPIFASSDGIQTWAYYAPNAAGGSDTVTVAATSSADITTKIVELAGVAITNPLISSTAKWNNASSLFSDYAVVPGSAVLLGYAFAHNNNPGISLTPSSGYLSANETDFQGTGSWQQFSTFSEAGSAGPYSLTATMSSGNADTVVGLMAFSAAAPTVPWRRQIVTAQGSTSETGTFGSSNLAGSLLLVAASNDFTGTWGISDAQGNSYTVLAGGSSANWVIWYCLSAKAGSNAVTVTRPGGAFMQLIATEYVAPRAWALDVSNTNTATGSSGISSGSVTTTQAVELLISTANFATTNNTDIAGISAWSHTARGKEHDNQVALFDQVVASTGTYSNSFTPLDGNSYTFNNAIAGFYAAAPVQQQPAVSIITELLERQTAAGQ
jgi:hypothetical protein